LGVGKSIVQMAGAKIECLHVLASAYTHRAYPYKNLWLPGITGALEAVAVHKPLLNGLVLVADDLNA
jgi:hypothetical protein